VDVKKEGVGVNYFNCLNQNWASEIAFFLHPQFYVCVGQTRIFIIFLSATETHEKF
jgi:hypothetical protein